MDTEGLKFQAWKEALLSRGVVLAVEHYLPLVGYTGIAILERLCREYDLPIDPTIVDEKNVVYKDLQRSQLQAIAPMRDVLEWVKIERQRSGWLLGVATAASREEVRANLDFLQVGDLFDVVLSGKDDLAHYSDPMGVNKPHPYIYLEACRQLGVTPSKSLVLEDSGPGIHAAKTAGCKVIAIPTEWTLCQNFENADLVLRGANAEKIIKGIQHFLAKVEEP